MGYSQTKVSLSYEDIKQAKLTCNKLKDHYYNVVESRRLAQTSVNRLLPLKSSWTKNDVDLFTKAVTDENLLENEERIAKDKLIETERHVESLQQSFEDLLRERYQEELLVHERNKGTSNLLTWGLMLANLGMFVLTQILFEPNRKRSLIEKLREEINNEIIAPVSREFDHINEKLSIINESISKQDQILLQLNEENKVIEGIAQTPSMNETSAPVIEKQIDSQEMSLISFFSSVIVFNLVCLRYR